MTASAVVIAIAHRGIAALYTADVAVAALAAKLLVMAGIFQVSDGLQVGAQGALRGDISGVTLGLGITFNATLTALVSCIVVMFCLHQLQQAQDRLVLDARMYIDRRLIRNMRVS